MTPPTIPVLALIDLDADRLRILDDDGGWSLSVWWWRGAVAKHGVAQRADLARAIFATWAEREAAA